jgi:acyl phosphate:glycerol-3-phosphate acyltransferase
MITIIIIAYLIGSIPFGFLLTKMMGGGDIRQTGSGNIGATNVMRLLGKKAGYLTFILDSVKGIIPIIILSSLSIKGSIEGVSHCYLVGFITIIGHCYPIWLKFKGGKGVATAIGVVIYSYVAFAPDLIWVLLILTAIWFISYKLTKIVSVSSIALFIAIPVSNYFALNEIIMSTLFSCFIIWRHKTNIVRLINGTENDFRK